MPALLTGSGRPGFYFRVLREGEVGAGDVIVKVGEAKERITVAEINALLYSPNHPRDQLERALRIEALSPGWRGSLAGLGRQDGCGFRCYRSPVAIGFRPSWNYPRSRCLSMRADALHDRHERDARNFVIGRGAIHVELFNGSESMTPGVVGATTRTPHLPRDDASIGSLVSFARSGIAAHWNASAYQSILELAEACDVPVRWSCRTGVCHSCESGLVSGAVVYGPEPLEKPAGGNVLVCCSQPIRDVVIDL
jgi:ferredoxin